MRRRQSRTGAVPNERLFTGAVPVNANANDGVELTLGMSFYVTEPMIADEALWRFPTSAPGAQVTAQLWTNTTPVAGVLIDSGVFPAVPELGEFNAAPLSGLTLMPGTLYKVSCFTVDRYVFTSGVFTAPVVSPTGALVAIEDLGDPPWDTYRNGTYRDAPVMGFPANTPPGQPWYGLDISCRRP